MSERQPIFLAALVGFVLTAGPGRAADVDRYVPDNARLIAHVNLRQVLDAPLTQKYAVEEVRAALQKHPEVQQILHALGLDPFRDLQSATLVGLPSDDKFNGLAIVRGRFDPARMRATADQFARDHPDELKVHTQAGVAVYEAVHRGAKERIVFAALIDPHVLVLAPVREPVAAAVGRREITAAPKLTRDLQALVAKIDGRQSAWLAGVVTDDVKKELARSLLGREKAGQVKSVTGGLMVSETIQGEFQIHTTSAHTASDLRKMLEGLKALTAFAIASNKNIPAYGPLFADLIRSVKITTGEGTVTGRATITPTQIEKGLRKGHKP